MDLIEINKKLLSSKQNHMKHAIKYRKIVKKIISLIDVPEVLYKFIFNFVGSAPFPMTSYYIHRPHSFPRNNLSQKMIDENNQSQ